MQPDVLDPHTWHARQAAHTARVSALIEAHLDRQRDATPHPVEDFLFTYYFLRPNQLRRWHPGAGVVLAGADPAVVGPEYVATPLGATLDTATVLTRRRTSVNHVQHLLTATASRQAQFGCFGMHEWAMVYRQDPAELRHGGWPLRLAPQAVADIVEAGPIRCTHFDAYRFFTPSARPLNLIDLSRHNQAQYEQPGCLHANMDLYKWSYKLGPLIPSELVVECFELARDIRMLDMKASPYDLLSLGLVPLLVETPEGRAEYAHCQRVFADRAAVLRARLIEVCAALLTPRR